MKYADKLRSPKWQRMRLTILNRDGFKCRDCGSEEKSLSVHHHYYIRSCQPWEYPPELLSTLCEDCHSKRQRLEEAVHASIAKRVAELPLAQLESVAWDLIHGAIRRTALQ